MNYLVVRNPGVADYRGFTLLGVSTTRDARLKGTIGQFGSGSKLAVALLMRRGINPVVVCGHLQMKFWTKDQTIQGQRFRQVCVSYSGRTTDGTSKSSTEELGFTLEWGVQDWNRLSMAVREVVSNAIDGSIVAGRGHLGVEIDVVDEIRAKGNHTQVFIPYTEDIERCHKSIKTMFLHFGSADTLTKRCIEKRFPEKDEILIYKKGVLVCKSAGKSVFDYNLGNELTLDESRNATEWDVKHSVGKALRDETPEVLAKIMSSIVVSPNSWEASLPSHYLKNNPNADKATVERRKEAFACAWKQVAGPKGVATSGVASLDSFVEEKGYEPISVPKDWLTVLESYDVPCESKVLSRNELDGKVLSEPTLDMLAARSRVWILLDSLNLTNGKQAPGVKGFTSVMEGGSQTFGYYVPGGNDIYLHTSLSGRILFKVALEEIVHYATGADDKSRDIQDFLFNLVTEMAFKVEVQDDEPYATLRREGEIEQEMLNEQSGVDLNHRQEVTNV